MIAVDFLLPEHLSDSFGMKSKKLGEGFDIVRALKKGFLEVIVVNCPVSGFVFGSLQFSTGDEYSDHPGGAPKSYGGSFYRQMHLSDVSTKRGK